MISGKFKFHLELFLLIISMLATGVTMAQRSVKAAKHAAGKQKITAQEPDGLQQRAYFVQSLVKIGDPVLQALSKGELKKKMPVEAAKGVTDRSRYTYLEALGRLLSGMAPWLELGPDATAEGKLREKYIQLAVAGIKNAADPRSPDYMNFNEGGQPLVDAAFLAQALLRAPEQLWGRLDESTKANVIRELKSSRIILPSQSNWLLFSAMVEAALLKFDNSGDRMRMDYAIRMHMNWYKGDGAYGDGAAFHWDYYNSFVIQPMLVDVTRTLTAAGFKDERIHTLVMSRAQRYAAVQERFISPEGTYPPIGRSLAYRFGAFQSLSQIAFLHQLPPEVTPEQVRCALYSVIKNQIEAPGTFDQEGWLRIGVYGSQPGMGEGYISTGSLYLCSVAYLVLGLPPDDDFWKKPNAEWTQKKIWSGKDMPADHAIKN
ncbi:DUF2264 domain-containing protein [Niabella aquatica]